MERRKKAIQFHIQKAHDLLQDVHVLVENDRFSSVVSRLYYACFHAASALLLTRNLVSKTHKGLQTQLHTHFTSRGILQPNQAKFFARLFEERMEDDDGDFYIADKEDVVSYIQPTIEFIQHIENIIQQHDQDQ